MILCALAVSGLLLVLFTTCPAQESQLVATEANPRLADPESNEGERSKLSPKTLQMARIIGVESDIEKLSSLAAAKGASGAHGRSLDDLSLRQQITDAVVAASLDVDSVAAEIETSGKLITGPQRNPFASHYTSNSKGLGVQTSLSRIRPLADCPSFSHDPRSGLAEILSVLQLNVCAKRLIEHFIGF